MDFVSLHNAREDCHRINDLIKTVEDRHTDGTCSEEDRRCYRLILIELQKVQYRAIEKKLDLVLGA